MKGVLLLFNIVSLVTRLATPDPYRTEADIQSEIQTLLLHGGLNLTDPQVRLESQLHDGSRRRIDVESGATVIEVKKTLANPNAVAEFEKQLSGYVVTRTQQTGARYVGVLTDGCEWRLYCHQEDEFCEITRHLVNVRDPEAAERLTTWLEAVMATRTMVTPTPQAIKDGLGNSSPSFALDISDIKVMYEAVANNPEVTLKRSLWSKLLTTALGTQFSDDTNLFVEHTYLVLIAEVVAHAVVGFNLEDDSLSPSTIVTGGAFNAGQITGVVEQDFFDWILHAPGGDKFVTRLARRVARYNWSEPEHDVLKVLYESVIDSQTRHSLGEYYTPDWMAERIIQETVTDPLNQRVLDPSCGSGTFVFHAVRNYLTVAENNGMAPHTAVSNVTRMVTGIDLHPVAVTLARVTYLLAIGSGRIQDPLRESLTIPIYLGDSLQWEQTANTMTFGDLIIPTEEGFSLYSRELRFPARVTSDASTFDRLVERLSTLATERSPGSAVPNLTPIYSHFTVHPDDQAEVTETFTTLCQLVDEGRNHIWSYYVRNTARPIWLSQPDNHADVLVGNPPWLSYRYMPEAMQIKFKKEAQSRGLWAGGKVATHQDLSAYFVARTTELYLKPVTGRFAFVMPHAVLSRIQYAGFRSGIFEPAGKLGRNRVMKGATKTVEFSVPWDFLEVRPHPFPVPSCVIFGVYSRGAVKAMPNETMKWMGRLPLGTVPWNTAERHLHTVTDSIRVVDQDEDTSPYKTRFTQGSNLVPRMLVMVTTETGGPLGVGAGRVSVRSARSTQEKHPWKELPSLSGTIESEFLYDVYLGSNIAPYRALDPVKGVIPLIKGRLLSSEENPAPIDNYPGVAQWWRAATAIWMANRTRSSKITLPEQFDWQGKLGRQYPAAPYRVVYTASGSILTSAIITNKRAVIEHKLYWANCGSLAEARYLTGILNSNTLLALISGLQSQGQFGARDFDTYVFHANYGLYNPEIPLHNELVTLVEHAETLAIKVGIDLTKSFQTNRKSIREVLTRDGVSTAIDDIVSAILAIPIEVESVSRVKPVEQST